MTKQFKFTADANIAYLLHQRTLQENRCVSDLVRRAVQQYLAIDPANEPDVGIERIEFGEGKPRATACYLSGPISAAVRKLAKDQARSQSYIVRALLRHSLREIGTLPTTTTPTPAPDNTADVAQ